MSHAYVAGLHGKVASHACVAPLIAFFWLQLRVRDQHGGLARWIAGTVALLLETSQGLLFIFHCWDLSCHPCSGDFYDSFEIAGANDAAFGLSSASAV